MSDVSDEKEFLSASEAIARDLGHHYVGTEHLLLAALQSSAVTKALAKLDVDLTPEGVAHRLIRPRSGTDKPAVFVTNRCLRALDAARTETGGFHPLRLLLALTEDGEGVAGQLLEDAGLTASALRALI